MTDSPTPAPMSDDQLANAEAWQLDLERRQVIDPTAAAMLLGDSRKLLAEVRRLRELINTPELHDFAAAVALEAAHQRDRWKSNHDAGKTDADWLWLIGYLAGKALHNPPNDMPPADARKHRIITIAAAAANWHAAICGIDNSMRPGIDTPPEGNA